MKRRKKNPGLGGWNIVIYDGSHYTDKILTKLISTGNTTDEWKKQATNYLIKKKKTGRFWVDVFSGKTPVTHYNLEIYKTDLTRSKNPVKKKRSAKQLANDRRLGRMAKARAKAKRGGRRKVTKRKVTKRNPHKTPRKTKRRTKLAKSHLWSIFKCYGKSVRFLGLTTGGKLQWTIRDAAIILKSKERAAKIAKKVSTKRGMANYHIGVASRETTSAQIAAACSK